MRVNMKTWPIFSVKTRETKIDPAPQYQRGPVWSLPMKQLLMDSILREYDIPKLYFRRVDRPPYEFEVVDGQQRLRAVWEYMVNDYPTSRDADPVKGRAIADQTYSQLDDDLKDVFLAYELHCVTFEDATDDEIEDMFVRLQNGVPLNAAEKRNALGGGMRDFVHDLATQHQFMCRSVAFHNRRYAHDELVAQMVLAEMNGGPCNARYVQLNSLFTNNRGLRDTHPKAEKVRKVLNYLARAFPDRTPELSKTNALSLYILTSELLEKYAIRNRHEELRSWFMDFESRRREDESRDPDQRDGDLVQYQLFLNQSTASQSALQHRHRVLMTDFLTRMANLERLDRQRAFDDYQRLSVYRIYNGICTNPDENPECLGKCEWDNFHVDHIVPFSGGGKTIVSNAQLLCPSCNLKKGASTVE